MQKSNYTDLNILKICNTIFEFFSFVDLGTFFKMDFKDEFASELFAQIRFFILRFLSSEKVNLIIQL